MKKPDGSKKLQRQTERRLPECRSGPWRRLVRPPHLFLGENHRREPQPADQAQFTDESQQKEPHDDNVEPQNALEPHNADNNNIGASGGGGIHLGCSRWPKAEMQALIRVRSGLEMRFQEPGLKALWEEVSLAMARLSLLGYVWVKWVQNLHTLKRT